MFGSVRYSGAVGWSACLLVLAGSQAALQATTIRVPVDFPTIQAAVNIANNGDTILVADGIYRGDGNRDIGLQGKAITVRSAHGPAACIIDCEGTQAAPHRGFLLRSGETTSTVIDGFTIRNGYAPIDPECLSSGGAILCTAHSGATIRNCILTGNRLDPDG